jgi:hypothetical protein
MYEGVRSMNCSYCHYKGKYEEIKNHEQAIHKTEMLKQ